MRNNRPLARRLFVVSDLHMGGEPPAMMSSSQELAQLIDSLEGRKADDERLELIIAGDFVDFLAVPPFAAFTPVPSDARAKLEAIMGDPTFASVFDALG